MNSIKIAIKSLWRNKTMTFSSILLVFLTVLVAGAAGLASVNFIQISDELVNNLTLYVLVDKQASEEQINEIQPQIEQIAPLESIELQKKEDLIKQYSKDLSDEEEKQNVMLELFSGDKNPLSDQYKVQLKNGDNIEAVAKQIETIPNVSQVSYGDPQTTSNFINTMHSITFACIVGALILFIVAILIIINTIKLTITYRRKEIEIMRLVGATKWYVRLPFIWEGIIFGLVGGAISFGVLIGIYSTIVTNVNMASGVSFRLFPLNEIIIPLGLIVFLVAILIGYIGSVISTHRYLKK